MDRVVLSRDCDDGIALQVKEACAAANVPCVTAGSKKDLGRACGIERPAAVVGFVKAAEPSLNSSSAQYIFFCQTCPD